MGGGLLSIQKMGSAAGVLDGGLGGSQTGDGHTEGLSLIHIFCLIVRSPSGGAVPTEFKGDFRHLFSYKPQSIKQIERVPILTKYHIQGGKPLSGTITISGAKNAAVAIIPAALLVDGVCRIENIPQISDVTLILQILQELGADVRTINPVSYTHLKM